ncbi:MAG: hypothetical protein RL038_688 [Actinomycetota bacterium]
MSKKLIRFTFLLGRNSRLKYLMLVGLVATGVLVFFVLSELSRAAQNDLDRAVEGQLGLKGVYTAEFSPDFNITLTDLTALVPAALENFPSAKVSYVRIFPQVNIECPPDSDLGDQQIFVFQAQSAALETEPLDGSQINFETCLQGQKIPRNALRPVTDYESRSLGPGFVLHPDYLDLMSLAATEEPRWAIVINLNQADDYTYELNNSLWQAFSSEIERDGLVPQGAVLLNRIDQGSALREATDGIRLVYSVIAWMTLALVALAVAVAELFIIRDRMWLFGLSRASGARRIDITKIVILDVVGVLILGVTAAIALSLIFSPAFRNFGESVFQTEIVLFRLDLLPLLLVFLVFGVGIGSLIPVLKVLKLDPADSIELR